MTAIVLCYISQDCILAYGNTESKGLAMLKGWQAALDEEYPETKPVTERTVVAAQRQGRWLRGSVRLTMGRIVTDAQYHERRKRALSKSL